MDRAVVVGADGGSIRSANSGSIEAGHSSIQSEYPGSIEAE